MAGAWLEHDNKPPGGEVELPEQRNMSVVLSDEQSPTEWPELQPRAVRRSWPRSLAVIALALTLLIGLGYLFATRPLFVNQGNLTLEQVVAIAQPAVVYIEVPHTNGRTYAQGSGVIIDEDGIIVTNQHVIADGSEINVVLNDGRSFVASVLGSDASMDIAVIRISCAGLSAVRLGNSDHVAKRQRVVAIGNPGDARNQATEGEILLRRLKHEGQLYIVSTVATDHGSSGGALLNYDGQIIGITSAGAEVNGQKVTLAVPINAIKALLP